MKKLEIKQTIISDGDCSNFGERISVREFVNTGFFTWINMLLRPFGMQLAIDSDNDRIYPVKANMYPLSTKAQEKMFRNMGKWLDS